MNKKGISGVVVMVLMIALVMVSMVIVWTVVNNLIQERVSGSESCFGVFEKVKLDGKFTCFNDNSGADEVQFFVNIGNIEVDEVLVSIAYEAGSDPFTITNEGQTISGLRNFDGSTDNIQLPSKNGGKTYIAELSSPISLGDLITIQIAPVINGNQCEVSSSISKVEDCQTLA